ncbi:MAG: nuclear transport factor 2 family protein [Stanieria sp.]
MSNSIETEIIQYEARLREAMLQSDVKALDELLAPELIFTTHLGELVTKQDDLKGHSSGALAIKSLTPLEQTIRLVGNVAIVLARVYLVGTYAGMPSEADLRFTRVWISTPNGWQVIVAHSSVVA